MKELPYFRFTIQEWQNGNISTLNDSLKGVFIDICAFYWAQNCSVTFESLSNKFKSKSKSIQKLIDSQTFCNQNGIVSISFLDQQLSELKQTKSFFSKMGIEGQKAKKLKAPLKTDLSYKDKDKDKDKDNIKRGFKRPTIQDIESYCFERSNKVDPEKFFDYYQANGWNVGKNSMKDWKAAVSTWEKRETEQNKGRENFSEREGRLLRESLEKTERKKHASKLKEFRPRQSSSVQGSNKEPLYIEKSGDIGGLIGEEV